MIRARGLTKRFGQLAALDGLDLEVETGEAVAVFGPNGAGKTTLIRILALALRRDAGSLEVMGLDPRSHDREIRAQIGLIAHESFLYDDLTPTENLLFYAGLYGVRDAPGRARALVEAFGLALRADDRTGSLSRGMRQRLSVARALLHEPPLLLLDEPFSGLDPRAAERLRQLLSQLRQEHRTLILVTHDLRQGLALSDRFIVLDQGRVTDAGTSRETDAARFEARYLEQHG